MSLFMGDVWCIKVKIVTPNIPGTTRYVTTKNERTMFKAVCTSCEATKPIFVKANTPKLRRGCGVDIPKAIEQA